ncbi:MAG: cyclomaltodextrinase / maltogenic alpha-amylase / neopullulanase [Clostridiales bacterium]|nr:cyclomaltodextrinase / maltogenic alpha-amylase / neopullulanase [Clostridiales bacterium]
MVKEAISHENTVRFVHAESRECLKFCIRAAKKDIRCCRLIYFSRNSPEEKKEVDMLWKYRDQWFDYFEADIEYRRVARYQKYYFYLEDDNAEAEYLNAYGFSKQEPKDEFFEFLYANQGDICTIPRWAKGQIFYQIFPERFANGKIENNPSGCEPWGSMPTRDNYMGGDLEGIRQNLDYLEQLGIECLYLNPIFFGDFNHKYATTDYFLIDPMFGTKEEFRSLVEECHARGIKIILDGVFNHTGIHFAPFQDILKKQKESVYKDWFYITEFPVSVSHHNYECVGAYKWMPKLNTSNQEVKKYIIEVMEYWIKEYGIDGWRLDVADEVDKNVWYHARSYLKAKYPDILLLGETWGYAVNMMRGDQMDSVMNYVFRDFARDFFAYESIDTCELDHRINRMLATYFWEAKHGLYNLLDSHDTERFLFLCGEDKRKLRLAAAFQFLFPGAPAIFYGDEIGLTGGNDPYCRKAMKWKKEEQDEELFKWYQILAKIRKEESCIRDGDYATILCSNEEGIIGFVRFKEKDNIYVLFNRSEESQKVIVPVIRKGIFQDRISGETTISQECSGGEPFYNKDVLVYEGKINIALEPYTVKIIKKL